MSLVSHPRPAFTLDAVRDLLAAHFGVAGTLAPLDSERDQNVHVDGPQGAFVVKIANAAEPEPAIRFQNALLRHLHRVDAALPVPGLKASATGDDVVFVTGPTGERHALRLVSYLPGRPIAHGQPGLGTFRSLGHVLGRLDRALQSFGHPGAFRDFDWDIRQTPRSRGRLDAVRDPGRRALVTAWLDRFDAGVAPRLDRLPHQVIHNDANDWNVLADPDGGDVTGVIDVGDAVFGPRIADVAVACAYAMLPPPVADHGPRAAPLSPLSIAAAVAGGFHAELPLTGEELDVLLDLVAARLCISVTLSAVRRTTSSDPYLFVSEAPAWALLETLSTIDRAEAAHAFHLARVSPAGSVQPRARAALLAARQQRLGRNLGLSYREPLHVVKGEDVWLVDDRGRRYLDCYNNVAHVGHAHPRVVAALAAQAADLNTNTRYLHELVVAYADRLAATLPPGLDCFYVCNSGSEANDLALRIARTVTGRRDVAVLDWAYHGHTQALIEISPYKYKRRGGAGRPPFVHELPLPDPFRAPDDWPTLEHGARFAAVARRQLRESPGGGRSIAAFIAETIPSVGGQVVLPDGYLADVYATVRDGGGLCIADEVQVGFGRVGTAMWAFSEHGVVPDIVTMGKPAGAGHPLAVVATTQAIGAAFANGMEYFNTFGGNPVSCAVGLAVLDVLRDGDLLANARVQGDYLLDGFRALRDRHDGIGDVRGRGLFLGIEMVVDRRGKTPDGAAASAVVQAALDRGVLIGTDGPHENVIKLRPPMTFTRAHADRLLAVLDEALAAAGGRARGGR